MAASKRKVYYRKPGRGFFVLARMTLRWTGCPGFRVELPECRGSPGDEGRSGAVVSYYEIFFLFA
jgi:hypothetical protein